MTGEDDALTLTFSADGTYVITLSNSDYVPWVFVNGVDIYDNGSLGYTDYDNVTTVYVKAGDTLVFWAYVDDDSDTFTITSTDNGNSEGNSETETNPNIR